MRAKGQQKRVSLKTKRNMVTNPRMIICFKEEVVNQVCPCALMELTNETC